MIKERRGRNRLVGGLLLIAIGVIALAANYFESSWFGPLLLFALAAAFMIAGIAARNAGYFIPGGILAGVGMGTAVTMWPNLEIDTGGGFLLAFALGWFLIPIFSILFTNDRHLWALIPGGIIGLVGVGLVWGGVAWDLMTFIGRIWPIFLILGGLYILFRRRASQEEEVGQPVEKFEG